MKNRIKILTALFMTTCVFVTGCGLADDALTATEYVNDEGGAQESDEADKDSSKIVLKDLFEPVLDNSSADVSALSEEEVKLVEDDETVEETVEIVFFGDSQIATGREEGSDIPTLLGGRVPNSKVYNLAIGGTTASLEKSTSEINLDKLTSLSFVGMTSCLAGIADRDATLGTLPDLLETMNQIDPAQVDYYFIEYGANDFFEEVPLDTDMYADDQLHNYYGGLKTGIDQLKRISPDAEIILMTPFYGIYNDPNGTYIGDSYIVSNGIGTLADYAEKANNVAEDAQITPFDGMFRTKCDLYLDTASEYLFDGLHLNLTGRQIFARLLSHYVNYKEMNEPYAYLETDYIKIAEFDPYEYYRYDEGEMKNYFPESWEKYIAGQYKLAKPSEEALKMAAEDTSDASSESTSN